MPSAAPTASGGAPRRTGELRPLLSLAWPLIGNNLAIAGMNFSDAVMAGRLSGVDLAAVAIGNSVWAFFFLAALGVLNALSPIVAHCYGGGRFAEIGSYVREGVKIALALGISILAVLQFGSSAVLEAIGIDPAFRDLAVGYVKAIAWGAPAICVYLVLRFVLEGVGWTRPILLLSLLALITNVVGNYVFMYGHFGAPAMGAVGCGVASALTMWLLAAAMFVFAARSRRARHLGLFQRPSERRHGLKREILSLGVPISANLLAEVGLFVGVSLLMGTLSADAAAAHQIAINFASTVYMVPMALASATTVRVGQALGEGQFLIARRRGYVGIGLCAAFMTVSAVVLLVFRDQVVGVYTSDPTVGSIAISLLFMAAVFQISDGVQVGAVGALRGFKDTRVPLATSLIAFWAVGFPLAWTAAHGVKPVPHLVWLGLVAGLSVAAACSMLRYAYLTRRRVSFTARSSAHRR